jgi:exonuclease III
VINTKNFLWSKISKEALNSDKDLYICGTYIPPEKSQYYDKDIFEEFENDINQISPSSNIIILGDFNARTGKLNDALSDEGNKHVPDKSEQSHQTPERESFDLTVNNHGENLIEICKNNDLRILNGRTKGNSPSRPTFHGKNGTSVIDYIICSQDLLQNIQHLVISTPCYLSDHSQITTWINLHTHETELSNNDPIQTKLEKLLLQYIWTNYSKDIFI